MEAFVSQAEFARIRGVSRKTVTKWKQSGLVILDNKGNVDVAASGALLEQRPEVYRGQKTNRASEKVKKGETVQAAAERIAKSSGFILRTHAEAIRFKENYLGLLTKLKYDLDSGAVVPIDEVIKRVAKEYGSVRSRLLSLPARVASRIAVMASPEEIKALLLDEVTEALEELVLDDHGLSDRGLESQSPAGQMPQ